MTPRVLAQMVIGLMGVWWFVEGVLGFVQMVLFSTIQGTLGDMQWAELYGPGMAGSAMRLIVGIGIFLRRESLAIAIAPPTDAELSSSGGETGETETPEAATPALDTGSLLSIAICGVGLYLVGIAILELPGALTFLFRDFNGSWELLALPILGPVLTLILGLVLALGPPGVRRAWRTLRPPMEEGA